MKLKKLKVYLILLLATINCDKTSNENVNIAFITASELRCREFPRNDAKIKTKFRFGTPIAITSNSKLPLEQTNNWYQVENENCYVFGEYLYIDKSESKEIKIFEPDVYKCIDTEFEEDYPIFIIGNTFLAIRGEMIGPSPSPENHIFKIGRISTDNTKIIFYAEIEGIFNPLGEWIKKKKIREKFILNFKKENEVEYLAESDSKFKRSESIKNCKNPTFESKSTPFETYYFIKNTSFETLRKKIKEINEIDESDKNDIIEYLKENEGNSL